MRGNDSPLLLLTNDDGFGAQGLNALAEAMAEVGEVVVCAPASQQSAVGHGITLGTPLRVIEHGPGRFAITGRPADAVFLGLGELCPRRPDLVVSGINHGPNLGVDVLYSGTVAGAMEAATRDIPALSVSQMLPKIPAGEGATVSPWHGAEQPVPELEAPLRRAASFAALVARQLLESPLPAGTVLNLNAPVEPTETYRWTRLGRQLYQPSAVKRHDPRGIPYYWIDGKITERQASPGTDIHAVLGGSFSLTPLSLDRTANGASRKVLSFDSYQELVDGGE